MSFLLLAVAVALKQAVTPEFKLYQKEVIANAQVMSRELQAKGYKVVTGKFYWVKSYRPKDINRPFIKGETIHRMYQNRD